MHPEFFSGEWQSHPWVKGLVHHEKNNRGGGKKFDALQQWGNPHQAAQLFVLLRNIICHKGLTGNTGSLVLDYPFASSKHVVRSLTALAGAAFD